MRAFGKIFFRDSIGGASETPLGAVMLWERLEASQLF